MLHRLQVLLLAFMVFSTPLQAARIANPVAIFTGLDKITGVTTSFEARIGEEKQFGGLLVKADVCYTRPITEEPKTVAFVEVAEAAADKQKRKLFSGWMFAQSPGLNALEHPVYDVWLVNCKDPNAPPPPVEAPPQNTPDDDQSDGEDPLD